MLDAAESHFVTFVSAFRAVRRRGKLEVTLLSLSAGKALASPEPPRRSMCQGSAALDLQGDPHSLSKIQVRRGLGTG